MSETKSFFVVCLNSEEVADSLEAAAKVAESFAKPNARLLMRKGMGLSCPVTAKPLALQALRISKAIRALPLSLGSSQ